MQLSCLHLHFQCSIEPALPVQVFALSGLWPAPYGGRRRPSEFGTGLRQSCLFPYRVGPRSGVIWPQPSVTCHPRQGSDGKAQSPPELGHTLLCSSCALAPRSMESHSCRAQRSPLVRPVTQPRINPGALSRSQEQQLLPVFDPPAIPPHAWAGASLLTFFVLSTLSA